MHGLTDGGEAATTMLCFMMKSIKGNYRDIISLYPIHNLTAEKLKECFEETMLTVRNVSLNVVGISVDNASVNRKFYTSLCHGNLKTHVMDPMTGQPIFLFFDPVHNIKNLYNNFQTRKQFECPPMPNYFPNGCLPTFDHVIELYEHESCMTLKKAYKLNPSVLQPKSIERTSVRLALNVFSESTRDALMYYSQHEDKLWTETASFISYVIKLWNILNVKSPTKGRHKRNISADPVCHSMDWKLQFLEEFSDFLQVIFCFLSLKYFDCLFTCIL